MRKASFPIIWTSILGVLILLSNSDMPDVIEMITGVPTVVVMEALDNNVATVMVNGTEAEKHAYAKGQATRFGKLGINADNYLKNKLGWSEKQIHSMGKLYGFSKEWSGPDSSIQ